MLLDSANLCNPTVLDRLNPLLEPHGGQATSWGGLYALPGPLPPPQRRPCACTLLLARALLLSRVGSKQSLPVAPAELLSCKISLPCCVPTPAGVLLLNECGGGGAGVRTVRPHPNFRLFLALDPR